MVARRLVHGALGVRSQKTAEQRQAEKDLLKSARGIYAFEFYHKHNLNYYHYLLLEQRHAQRASLANREKEIASAFDE